MEHGQGEEQLRTARHNGVSLLPRTDKDCWEHDEEEHHDKSDCRVHPIRQDLRARRLPEQVEHRREGGEDELADSV
eukprot:2821174-Alexandrium_andersonii.AAC.1